MAPRHSGRYQDGPTELYFEEGHLQNEIQLDSLGSFQSAWEPWRTPRSMKSKDLKDENIPGQ